MELADQQCQHPDTGPISSDEAEQLARQVPNWTSDGTCIQRELRFKGFREAVDFVLSVADIAEQQDHHPDITISYNMVKLSLTTHKAGGLTRNDFIMAAKVNRLVGGRL